MFFRNNSSFLIKSKLSLLFFSNGYHFTPPPIDCGAVVTFL